MRAPDLAVHVRHPGQSTPGVRLALQLAARLQAHIEGLHVVPLPAAAFSVPEAVTLQVMESEQRRRDAEAQAPWWRAELDARGLAGNWRVGEGDLAQVLCLGAAAADLLVMERPAEAEDAPLGFGATSRTVFAAGIPVLVVPAQTAVAETGRNVLVAWNGSREAQRALRGALPLLAQAAHITLLDGSREQHPEGLAWLPPLALPDWCERHRLHVRIEPFQPQGATGPALLEAAARLGADLIVLGAWGHSRITEMVLGGTTRALFRDSTLPMLVAH
ncbi:MAG: universal stress protein [Xanthomonadaceae bacterium]|nr:universal stress protein [Xanthomonadaceae bacterium]